jgi:hypothetical protein
VAGGFVVAIAMAGTNVTSNAAHQTMFTDREMLADFFISSLLASNLIRYLSNVSLLSIFVKPFYEPVIAFPRPGTTMEVL